ncbi:MAG TPA: hypothetical protein VG964_03335 [Candidatus Saccharimonadales bacterium]|nr:hypothetical protein [Candidatus Saccharimonadales bacterium]
MEHPTDWESSFPLYYDTRIEGPDELGILRPLYDTLGHLEQVPTGKDPRIRAFAEAARHLMLDESRLRMSLGFMYDFRKERGRPTPPLYAANLLMRVAQHHLRGQDNYAELSASPEGWTAGMMDILKDGRRLESFDTFLALHEVQTNVPARYMGPKLIMSLYRDRLEKLGRPIRLLDIGTSIGTGVKALMTNSIDHEVRVHIPAAGEAPGSAKLVGNPNVDRYINGLLAEPLEFGPSAAIDAMGVTDDADREWIKSCFYPSEVVENKGMILSEFEKLSNLNVPELQMVTPLDFSDADSVNEFMARMEQQGIEEFDVATIVTTLNQSTDLEAAQIIENAKKVARIVIIQDFCRVDPRTKSGFYFFPTWHPYTYRTAVIDQGLGPEKNEAARPEELLWWSSGRPTDVIIAPSASFFTSNVAL